MKPAEIMARKHCKFCGIDPDDDELDRGYPAWKSVAEGMERHIAALTEAGMVIVPREMPEECIQAGYEAMARSTPGQKVVGGMKSAYAAILEAWEKADG